VVTQPSKIRGNETLEVRRVEYQNAVEEEDQDDYVPDDAPSRLRVDHPKPVFARPSIGVSASTVRPSTSASIYKNHVVIKLTCLLMDAI